MTCQARSGIAPPLGALAQVNHWVGDLIDAMSVVVVVIGVCTSLGLGALQIVTGLQRLQIVDPQAAPWVMTNAAIVVIWVITAVAATSVALGVRRGIKPLSQVHLGQQRLRCLPGAIGVRFRTGVLDLNGLVPFLRIPYAAPALARHDRGTERLGLSGFVRRSAAGKYLVWPHPVRGRPAVRGGKAHIVDGPDSAWRNRAPGPHRNTARQAMDSLWTACGGVWTTKTVKRPRQQPAHPQYATYCVPLTCKQHTMPHSAQPQHQLLGSANAEMTPASAPAAAADRKQRPDATCEGKNG